MATMTQIIENLKHAERLGTLNARKWVVFTRPSLLIIDDVASRQLDKGGCELFAELISRRYEKRSIILMSNRPSSDWPRFYDTKASAEAIDKVVHHSTIITIKGTNYRLEEKLDQMGSLA